MVDLDLTRSDLAVNRTVEVEHDDRSVYASTVDGDIPDDALMLSK